MTETTRPLEPHALDVLAAALAEPDILTAWAGDSQHPLLPHVYTALAARAEQRASPLRAVAATWDPERRDVLTDTADHTRAEQAAIGPELSRLKWLLHTRRVRRDARPALPVDLDTDDTEDHQIEALLADLSARLC